MNLVGIKRILFKHFFENKIKKQVETTFKFRNILEVVRKREEFKLKLLESQKLKKEEMVNRYNNFIETIDWIVKNE